ncbi:MAG: glycosyltransferase family 2 protein [Planctomycetota bacterium]
MSPPTLSVVVAFHDMRREAPRTLHTLSPAYQRGVGAGDYEVLAVDVGSEPPLDEALVRAQGEHFRLLRFPRAPSPAAAINAAVRASRGAAVMACIDGARMLTPGILRLALAALRGFADPLVATLSWHLGPKVQNESMLEGYDQTIEDRLLESVDWRGDGYSLFRIGCLAQSSRAGWLDPIGESHCVAMRRAAWERLGGYDERFTSPGGGLVNPDFYRRACDLLGPPVVLLGEGTFHQFHGGVATNVPRTNRPVRPMMEEYTAIRGEPFVGPTQKPILLGSLSPCAVEWLSESLRTTGAVVPG